MRVIPARLVLLAGVVAGLQNAGTGAERWVQFKRNAARTGDQPNVELCLPLTRVLAIQFPSPIYASPAVWDNHVFVQDADGHLACIDALSRQTLWTRALGGINNKSSPALDATRVYVGSTSGYFYVLEAASGKVLKKNPVDGAIDAAPALTEDGVYVATLNGQLYKFDLNGTPVWHFDGGTTSATEIAANATHVVFFAGSDRTTQYILKDEGNTFRLVQKRLSSAQTCPQSGPVLFGEMDYAYQCFDSEFGTLYVNDRIVSLDSHDGRAVPALRGSKIYRGDKCFDFGELPFSRLKKHPQHRGPNGRPVWRVDPRYVYDGGFHASPVLSAKHLLVATELGALHFIALEEEPHGGDTRDRKPAWTFKIGARGKGLANTGISSTPALASGRVYVGGEDGVLYGLGQGKAAETRKLEIADEVTTRAAIAEAFPGGEWHTAGGDMGYSGISVETLAPPFRIRWRTRLWSTFKGPMIVAEQKVFCTGRSGLLAALDARNGEILWKTHHPGVESRPACTYADGKIYVLRTQGGQGDSPHVSGASGGPRGEGVWCHNAKTGERLWHLPMALTYHFNADGLALLDDQLLVCRKATGGGVDAVAIHRDYGTIAWQRSILAKPAPKLRGVGVRFSAVPAGGVWCLAYRSPVPAGQSHTLGLNPETGEALWRREDLAIHSRSRLASRAGVLVVFTKQEAVALDPKTGATLWVGQGTGPRGTSLYYMQALTDGYIRSKGQDDLLTMRGCANPVHANGYWFSHDTRQRFSSNRLVAKQIEGGEDKVVWEHAFLSNACPAPAIAYQRLYYSPNAEGIIYCFEMQD